MARIPKYNRLTGQEYKPPKGKPRFPSLIELALGRTGYTRKVRTSPTQMPKWVYNTKTKKMEKKGTYTFIPDKKYYYYPEFPMRGRVDKYWRGETLHPDAEFISKAGLESKQEPSSWHTSEPIEASGYTVRSSKGDMGTQVTNPGVIRSITADEIYKIDPVWAKENQIGMDMGHVNLPAHIREGTRIEMIASIIVRLRKMGLTKSEIFSTVKQIMSKKKASGERDWKWFNQGGVVDLKKKKDEEDWNDLKDRVPWLYPDDVPWHWNMYPPKKKYYDV